MGSSSIPTMETLKNSELLDFDYIGQCHNRISALSDELHREKPDEKENRHAIMHRLFRHNVFEFIEPKRRQYLDKLLIRVLTSLGHHINKNLLVMFQENRTSTLTTPTPARTSSSRSNSLSRSNCSTPISGVSRRRTRSMSRDSLNPMVQQEIELVIISSDEEDDIIEEEISEVKIESFASNPLTERSVNLDDITNYRDSDDALSLPSISSYRSEGVSQKWPPNTLLMVNRNDKANFFYDKNGVINMRPKKHIRYSPAGRTRQSTILHLVAKTLKLLESGSYMSKRQLYYHSLKFCRIKDQSVNQSSTQPQASQSNLTQHNIHSVDRSGAQQNGTQFSTQQGHSQSSINKLPNSQTTTRYSPCKLFNALDDLCCLVGCSKIHLHIVSQPKGLVYGNLKFKLESGESYDCSTKREGVTIPDSSCPIIQMTSDAKFMIIIEKDAVMQKLLKQEEKFKFTDRYKAILFTGKGYPDVTSRAFVNFVWKTLNIPILVLADADPHGIEIACSYKFGVYTTAFESKYTTVPQIRWLGLLPSDMVRLSIPNSKTLPLTLLDRRKLQSLISRPYLKARGKWMDEVNVLKELDRKAEIESLDGDGEYLINTYLPNKLRFGSWV